MYSLQEGCWQGKGWKVIKEQEFKLTQTLILTLAESAFKLQLTITLNCKFVKTFFNEA